jgi:hypothetical protein
MGVRCVLADDQSYRERINRSWSKHSISTAIDHINQSLPKEILADPTTEHRITTAAIRVRFHLPDNTEPIAMTPRLASVMRFASGVLLESLHVEMRRSHAMIATLVARTIASDTAFKIIAVWRVFPRENGHPELRVS